MKIILPESLRAHTVLWLINNLSLGNSSPAVTLDFGQLKRITPACLTVLASAIHYWRGKEKQISIIGLEKCPITAYLQRMDFLKCCEIDWNEDFQRHDSKGRFVPVCPVKYEVGEMGHQIASCLAPGGDDYEHPMAGLYDWAYYVFTEIANNIRQHSRGTGFAAAQVNSGEGLIRIALSDNGTGIRKSFIDAGYDWSHKLTDSEAILKALEPRVSSKGQPSNEGVGLTLVSELTHLTQAWLLIVSGNGVVRVAKGQPIVAETLPENGFFQGTLVAISLKQTATDNFDDLLYKAKDKAGLLHKTRKSIRFLS